MITLKGDHLFASIRTSWVCLFNENDQSIWPVSNTLTVGFSQAISENAQQDMRLNNCD
jgi:hypothetical protein